MPAKKKPADETPATEPATPAPAVTQENIDVIQPETPPPAADWTAESIVAMQALWTERTETRPLPVKLTEHEMSEAAVALTETLDACEQVKSEAKAAADDAKSKIESLTGKTNRLKAMIRSRAETRGVECRWIYNTAGTAPDGSIIVDPDKMTLVRMDTGAVVKVERIPDEDRQMPLPMEEEDPVAPAAEEAPVEEDEYATQRQQGRDAAELGIQRHRCPYEAGTHEAQAWKHGYDEAAEDAAEKQPAAA